MKPEIIVDNEQQLFIRRTVDIKRIEPALDPNVAKFNEGIRVYGSHHCAVIQLRMPTTKTRMIATASYLTKAEVQALIKRLKEIEPTLQ